MAIKQILVIRSDLQMRKGKMIAQGAHASQWAAKAAQQGCPEWFAAWEAHEYTKIALRVDSEAALLALHQAVQQAGLPCALIQDAGHTEFHGVKTYTALGIGPAPSEEIDPFTGTLSLL